MAGSLKVWCADPEIVVLGDSHALMWSGIVAQIASELNVTVSFYAAAGTPTFFDIPIKKKRNFFFTSDELSTFDNSD